MLERLNQDIKAALLGGDNVTVDALRFIKNSLDNVAKQKGSELTDQEVVATLRKELKKREEAAELFSKGGNSTAAEKEHREAGLIKTYLPAETLEEDIIEKIKTIINENNIPISMSSMGQVMALAKQSLGDSADPSVIARVASQLLKSGQ
jgi:uncharacterized protein YqeY